MSASDQVNGGSGTAEIEVEAAPEASETGPSPLRWPVTGLETELAVFVDGRKVDPESLWDSPTALMGPAPVAASGRAAPLAGGGVLYFDQGVLEIVTPVIELGPGAAARVVRNLWEQIGQVRDRITAWSVPQSRDVRLVGYSTHYNVSFEEPRPPDGERTVEKLALLLAHVLPAPVALVGGNRRSTGVGVRPRGNRIEVTADFTPDPGLMIATAALVVGVVRGAMTLPSYDLSQLAALPLATVEGMVPGKHSSRRGWLARDYDFPRSPFTSSVDARLWPTRDGRRLSLRALARETAWVFRRSLREHSDPFSFRLLFAILDGRSPSLLELPDRPGAYEDVGRACRWGAVLPQLQADFEERRWNVVDGAPWSTGAFTAHVSARDRARTRARRRASREAQRAGADRMQAAATPPYPADSGPARPAGPRSDPADGTEVPMGTDRRADEPTAADLDAAPEVDRRQRPALLEPRIHRRLPAADLLPDRDLARSRYEEVFLRLVAGTAVRLGGHVYRPKRMRGWYHAVFVGDDGTERVFSIDALRAPEVRWLDDPRAVGSA